MNFIKEDETLDLFWLHIKKCGGQSLRKAMFPFYKELDRKNPSSFIQLPKAYWNDNLNNYRVPLGDYDFKRSLFAKEFLFTSAEWQGMFKFAIVRNPFDRIISNWLYLKPISRKAIPRWLRGKLSLESFCDMLPELWETKYDRHLASHTAPIWPDVSDQRGECLLDYIGRLETIDDSLKEIEKKSGLKFKSITKNNSNIKRKRYRNYISRSSRRKIEQLYRQDFEKFDYDF